jgi:uncharacterized protein DUF1413
MGRAIQLVIDDDVLTNALIEAKKRGQTLDELVGEKLKEVGEAKGSADVRSETALAQALDRARAKEKGARFTVPELFPREEWRLVASGDRKTLGKLFRREAEAGKSPIARHVGRNKTNQAIYSRV